MGELEAAIQNKIRSAQLLEEVISLSDERHVVILEIDSPLPTLSVSNRPSLTDGRPSFQVDRAAPNAIAEAVKIELAKILDDQEPTYLPSSRSFIVEATGRQLHRIANIAAVVAIWPNTLRS